MWNAAAHSFLRPSQSTGARRISSHLVISEDSDLVFKRRVVQYFLFHPGVTAVSGRTRNMQMAVFKFDLAICRFSCAKFPAGHV